MPKCPECHEEIDHLVRTEVTKTDFSLGPEGEIDDEHEPKAVSYSCPKCEKELACEESGATAILEGKTAPGQPMDYDTARLILHIMVEGDNHFQPEEIEQALRLGQKALRFAYDQGPKLLAALEASTSWIEESFPKPQDQPIELLADSNAAIENAKKYIEGGEHRAKETNS